MQLNNKIRRFISGIKVQNQFIRWTISYNEEATVPKVCMCLFTIMPCVQIVLWVLQYIMWAGNCGLLLKQNWIHVIMATFVCSDWVLLPCSFEDGNWVVLHDGPSPVKCTVRSAFSEWKEEPVKASIAKIDDAHANIHSLCHLLQSKKMTQFQCPCNVRNIWRLTSMQVVNHKKTKCLICLILLWNIKLCISIMCWILNMFPHLASRSDAQSIRLQGTVLRVCMALPWRTSASRLCKSASLLHSAFLVVFWPGYTEWRKSSQCVRDNFQQWIIQICLMSHSAQIVPKYVSWSCEIYWILISTELMFFYN